MHGAARSSGRSDPLDPGGATITIGFELHRATNHNKPSLGTIVAVEGGPGYASTDSRDYYLDLFAPLLTRRDMLFVDARGTGTSSFINCPGLESLQGDYLENIRLCGEQLGASSDVYGTAFAADDLAAVLDALGIDRIDLYGDSYGTFFGQAFALRHPDRIRTLTLDAAYPVEDQDPWYRDQNRAMRDAFRFVCERDPGCAALGGDVIDRLAALADALRADPLAGQAYDADGVLRDVEIDASFLSYLTGVATYGTTVYEELDGAGRAWLERGDPAPLLRIAAEQTDWTEVGDPAVFSYGLYVAVVMQRLPAAVGHLGAVRRAPRAVRCLGGRASRHRRRGVRPVHRRRLAGIAMDRVRVVHQLAGTRPLGATGRQSGHLPGGADARSGRRPRLDHVVGGVADRR